MMAIHSFTKNNQCARQAGLATLFVAIILLLVSTLIVLAVGRAAIFDQTFTGNDLRSKELNQTAKSGLEYGLKWLAFPTDAAGDSIDISWVDPDTGSAYPADQEDEDILVGATATAIFPAASPAFATHSSGNTYVVEVDYELLSSNLAENPAVTRVTVTASPTENDQDSHLTKTVSVLALRADRINGEGIGKAPIIVEGCMSNVTGTADVMPGAGGVAVGSLGGNAGCVNSGSMDLNGGDVLSTQNSDVSLSQAIFGVSEATLDQMMYDLSQLPDSKVVYVDSTSPWSTDVPAGFDINQGHDPTSVDNQYILYFSNDAGCAKINGGVTIVGMVYYAKKDCDDQGWGAAKVYGTVAVSGDVTKMTANGQFIGNDLSALVEEINDTSSNVAMVPGTFKDY